MPGTLLVFRRFRVVCRRLSSLPALAEAVLRTTREVPIFFCAHSVSMQNATQRARANATWAHAGTYGATLSLELGAVNWEGCWRAAGGRQQAEGRYRTHRAASTALAGMSGAGEHGGGWHNGVANANTRVHGVQRRVLLNTIFEVHKTCI